MVGCVGDAGRDARADWDAADRDAPTSPPQAAAVRQIASATVAAAVVRTVTLAYPCRWLG